MYKVKYIEKKSKSPIILNCNTFIHSMIAYQSSLTTTAKSGHGYETGGGAEEYPQ